jgi:hypothetical protein
VRVLLPRYEGIKGCEEAHAALLANWRNPRGGLGDQLAKAALRAFNGGGKAVAELGAGRLRELGAVLLGEGLVNVCEEKFHSGPPLFVFRSRVNEYLAPD